MAFASIGMRLRTRRDFPESWEFLKSGHTGVFSTRSRPGIGQGRVGVWVWESPDVRKATPIVLWEGVSGIEDEDPAVSEIEFWGLSGWFGAGPPVGGTANPFLQEWGR